MRNQNPSNIRVFVRNLRGKPLMPTYASKARRLLKSGRAKIVGYKPFTIQLLYACGEAVQPVSVGVDEGFKYVGVSAVSQNQVLFRAEIELRQDVSSNLTTRAQCRHSRRNRKTRYRQPRFNNRRRGENWLPPSIQSKVDITFSWIDRLMALLPNPKLRIEVGKFDPALMQAIENGEPIPEGADYQNGPAAGYYDVRYYVFARDDYTCQVCKKKGGILHTHHIVYKSKGGTNRADNLITVCSDCHTDEAHKKGGVLYEWMQKGKKVKQYKAPTFMNIIRRRTFAKYPDAKITYGSETTPHRKELGLEKSHANDAVAITGINEVRGVMPNVFYIRQFRSKKRSLHEAIPRRGRKEPNRSQWREPKNVRERNGRRIGEEVRVGNVCGWISGFTGSCAYVIGRDGEYIEYTRKSGRAYKSVPFSFLSHVRFSGNWQFWVC